MKKVILIPCPQKDENYRVARQVISRLRSKGAKVYVDRKYEVFYHGTRQIAKISICNNVLRLYVNLDPQKYDKKQKPQKKKEFF